MAKLGNISKIKDPRPSQAGNWWEIEDSEARTNIESIQTDITTLQNQIAGKMKKEIISMAELTEIVAGCNNGTITGSELQQVLQTLYLVPSQTPVDPEGDFDNVKD